MKPTLAPASQRRCGNCLGAVSGQYCAHCGQRHKSARRHFRQLASDFFNDVLNLDTKLLNTLKPLLFKPGFLSTEYFADRRMRYVSPFKLYVILSIVAFFFIQQSVDVAIDGTIAAENATASDKSKNGDNLNKFTIGNFNGKPWSAESNPINIAWLPDAANDHLNKKLGRLEDTVKKQDWTQLMHAGLAATPQALLLMLPYFALLLKVAYLFRKRLYMEHLIVALHNHAFLLLAISLLLIGNSLWNWLMPASAYQVGELLLGWLIAWIPLYFLLGLKHIYQQSWKMTLFKFGLLGFCYINLLAFGLLVNVFIGVLLL
jgi:Protein of unknown function (DUF3667)